VDVIKVRVGKEDVTDRSHLVETQSRYAASCVDQDVAIHQKRGSPVAGTDPSTATQNPQLHTTHAPTGSALRLYVLFVCKTIWQIPLAPAKAGFRNTLLPSLSQKGPFSASYSSFASYCSDFSMKRSQKNSDKIPNLSVGYSSCG
jgi:hypothetical protein